MSRSLAQLATECSNLNISVLPKGKKIAKSDYESALREHYWLEAVKNLNLHGDAAVMPEQIPPMLSRNVKDVTENESSAMWKDGTFVAQEKLNGCRCVMRIRNPSQGRINHLTSRRISDQFYRLNELHDNLPHYRDVNLGDEWEDTVIDGEIMSAKAFIDTEGVVTKTILHATTASLNCGPEKSARIQARYGKMVLHAFDCMRYQGRDISNLPYVTLTKDGDIDFSGQSRYAYLAKVVARVIEVMGQLPCEHCSVTPVVKELSDTFGIGSDGEYYTITASGEIKSW